MVKRFPMGWVIRSSFLIVVSLLVVSAREVMAQEAQENPPESSASAGTHESDLDEAARLLFVAGRNAFNAGQYEIALSRFRQAYEASHRPQLLYNIGVTLDRLRRDQEALDTFRKYLEEDPDATNQAEIQARIRVLEEAIAAQQPAPAPETTTEQTSTNVDLTQPTERPKSKKLAPIFFIVAASAAVAVTGVTVWSALDTKSLNDDYKKAAQASGTTYEEARGMYNDAHNAQTRTNILIGVSAGLAAVAGTLAIFTNWKGKKKESETPTPQVSAGPTGFLIGASGTF